MSFAVAVSVFGENCDQHGWHINGLRFPTYAAAKEWGSGLMGRWTMAKEYRVEAHTDAPNTDENGVLL